MRIDDLREKLQDDLEQDFDDLLNAYVRETGSSGLRSFAASLVAQDLLSSDRFDGLVSEGLADDETPPANATPAPPKWTGGATAPFRKPTPKASGASAGDALAEDGPEDAPAEDSPEDAAPEDSPEDAPAEDSPEDAPAEDSPEDTPADSSAESASEASPTPHKHGTGSDIGTGEFIDDDKKGRTMFRRATGGELKETGDQRKRKRRNLYSRDKRCWYQWRPANSVLHAV